MIRTRHMYESKEELDAMRKKAEQCADLMERVLDSPFLWTRVGLALMRYCVNAMIYGWTLCYPSIIMAMSNEKSIEKEYVDLRDAFDNFKSIHSAGNAAVVYRLLRANWDNDEDWVVETQRAMEWFFGDLYEMSLNGLFKEIEARWFSVEDMLPLQAHPVLVRYANERGTCFMCVASLWRCHDGSFVFRDHLHPIKNVTHWKALPAPPIE